MTTSIIASIIGSGINGNPTCIQSSLSILVFIASIIGSGINGNVQDDAGIPSSYTPQIASIIGSGINGNLFPTAFYCMSIRHRFYYWKWN